MPRCFYVKRGLGRLAIDLINLNLNSPSSGYRFHESVRNPKKHWNHSRFNTAEETRDAWWNFTPERFRDYTSLWDEGKRVSLTVANGSAMVVIADDLGIVCGVGFVDRLEFDSDTCCPGYHLFYDEIDWARRWQWSASFWIEHKHDGNMVSSNPDKLWILPGLMYAGAICATERVLAERISSGRNPTVPTLKREGAQRAINTLAHPATSSGISKPSKLATLARNRP
jgi:hypothetical protein